MENYGQEVHEEHLNLEVMEIDCWCFKRWLLDKSLLNSGPDDSVFILTVRT